ncbi:MAG TPA: tRNA (adenosine(37)-N6)-threonylcarbamoyltransferase complex dimerization subunit type 1 TsaB, partial [Actinomycetota bacterium]|nr:tRNA (adenosine(37)-N6)-threonylcarbamoyltransferase complex dimerization subunit type 1 TsaB [Actinomycetota bacterium]
MLVLAVETSTPQSTVAIGTEQGVIGTVLLSWSRGHSEIVVPAVERLLEWSELRLEQLGGVAVGLG